MNIKRVFILEDSETSASLYEGLLSKYKCNITLATSMDEALEKMTKEQIPFDAYIFDLSIGEEHLNGLKLIGRANNIPSRTLIISGDIGKADTIKNIMNVYNIPRKMIMQKPPDKEGFFMIMDELLGDIDSGFLADEFNISESEVLKPLITSDITFCERKFVKNTKSFIKKLSFLELLSIITFTIILFGSLSTWLSVQKYKASQQVENDLIIYCENRFKHAREGTTPNINSYVKKDVTLANFDLEVKYYHEGFLYVLIYDTLNKNKPRGIWIPSQNYIEKKGLDKDKKLLDIIAETWIKAK